MTDFRALDRTAMLRGMAAYERGEPRENNPYHGYATSEREFWFEGWDNAKELEAME